jgi:D-serine deaminase-like pyridoxal phosphate-dependent protein
MHLDDLPSPAVLVEDRRLDANLRLMQARARKQQVDLRPHTKTHKSVRLARRQRELGAHGITVAKVGEAEVFAEAGFDDIRLAYTPVSERDFARLLVLMERARVSFCVDTEEGARAASTFFARHGRDVEVLLEVDCGYGRCGVPWDHPLAVRFAQLVHSLPGLRLAGILTHAGHAYHGPKLGETEEAALRRVGNEERDRMLDFAHRLRLFDLVRPNAEPAGAPRFEISIGSTPTMRYFENRVDQGFTITEIRPGNYVFNDAIQVSLGVANLPECALTVQATVISRHRDKTGADRLFLDAGKKVFTSDTGYGTHGYGILLYNARSMKPLPHAELSALSEEHGWVQVPGGATLEIGNRVRVVPNHACVVVNTMDAFFLVDGDDVLEEIRVDARGRVN